ncbi:MAG TPA: M23 family metallopeptidase [Clostridiales bacterium]|nr:M23 family metallopeptidase [Clostridiales bacterium]
MVNETEPSIKNIINMKRNRVNKIKRKNVNKVPLKFSMVGPINLIKLIKAGFELRRQKRLSKSSRFVKGAAEDNKKYFSITIVPHSSNDVKTYKVSNLYTKSAVSLTIFAVLSVSASLYFTGLVNENRLLKAGLNEMYNLNAQQKAILSKRSDEINTLLTEENNANLSISELTEKYREIVDKYVSGRINGGLASRSGDRSDSTFVNDIEELRGILTELEKANNLKEEKLGDLTETENTLRKYLDCLPTQWPVNGDISSKFGQRKDPISYRSSFHKGIDIAASYGTNIKAAGDGKVILTGSYNEYGLAVIIDHGNGLATVYGHTSKILVKKGQKVEKGEIIAKVGSSGRSTGSHLHFEIRVNDNPIDPYKYLDKR